MESNENAFWNKRRMEGSSFDQHRAEQCQQLKAVPQLDIRRAELSRQHVRALNTQFASWVQTQLKNNPDELWEDGARDYLSHSSSIKEKFSDVVNWLNTNSVNGAPVGAFVVSEKKSVEEVNNSRDEKVQGKPVFALASVNSSSVSSLSSSIFSSNQSPGGLFSGTQSSGLFSSSQSSGFMFSSQSSSSFSNSKSPGLFSANQSSGTGLVLNNASTGSFSSTPNSGGLNNSQSFGLLPNNQSTGLFSTSQTSGTLSNSQSFGLLNNNQTPFVFGGHSSLPPIISTSDKADDENDPEQPSSPSVKNSEEKGIVVVHEVKCKLYVKSTDPADKDAWKDKGTGQLSIKCKDGVDKGTKESKPTIIVRNDAGKVLLNALLYQGIKTNAQKNSLVAIFHTSDDGDAVVARTFLIRMKTEEDRNKLATAIQEYAPS